MCSTVDFMYILHLLMHSSLNWLLLVYLQYYPYGIKKFLSWRNDNIIIACVFTKYECYQVYRTYKTKNVTKHTVPLSENLFSLSSTPSMNHNLTFLLFPLSALVRNLEPGPKNRWNISAVARSRRIEVSPLQIFFVAYCTICTTNNFLWVKPW